MVDVDFFFSLEPSADAIYQLFRGATSDETFHGASAGGHIFGGQPYYDLISEEDGTTMALQPEDSDTDTNDFHLGTADGADGMYDSARRPTNIQIRLHFITPGAS